MRPDADGPGWSLNTCYPPKVGEWIELRFEMEQRDADDLRKRLPGVMFFETEQHAFKLDVRQAELSAAGKHARAAVIARVLRVQELSASVTEKRKDEANDG